MLTTRGRAVRVTAAAMVVAALVAASAVGSDDDFPVGPFRMYANATKLHARVVVPGLIGTTQAGRRVTVHSYDVGLRRAELEGQLVRWKDKRALLRVLARAYERGRRPRLKELRLVQRVRELDGRQRPTRLVAIWKRAS